MLVVGGGILGLVTAATCQLGGLGSISLIERDKLGAGSTGGAAGLLVPEAHAGIDPDWFVDLMRISLDLWRDLDKRWPGGVGLLHLDWLGLEPLLQAELTAALAGRAERLDANAVAKAVPDLRTPSHALRVQRQARLNPLRACMQLAQGLQSVATSVEATGVGIERGRIISVSTSIGEISPRSVVFATGGPPRLDGLALDLPGGYVKGHLIATEPTTSGVPGTVAPMATQLEEGRLLVGSSVDWRDDSPQVRVDVVESLWNEFAQLHGQADSLKISHQWCCFRPWHVDGMPVLDRVPSLSNAWLTSGHFKTGILMAAVSGRILADWIVSGQQPDTAQHLAIGSRFSKAPI